VADIIAPNTRQSVKASQLGYSTRVKPNIRPLSHVTCNCTTNTIQFYVYIWK